MDSAVSAHRIPASARATKSIPAIRFITYSPHVDLATGRYKEVSRISVTGLLQSVRSWLNGRRLGAVSKSFGFLLLRAIEANRLRKWQKHEAQKGNRTVRIHL